MTRPTPSPRPLAPIALAITLLLVGLGGPAAAEDTPATLTVVHGIPGDDLGLDPELPVDVYVAEADLCLLDDFRYGEQSDRIELPAGTYTVSVRLPDAGGVACGGDTVIGPAPIPLTAGENATVIAHLAEDFSPIASKYTNDLDPADPGVGRIALHHDAAVGAVDVRLYQLYPYKGRGPVLELEGVTNPQSAAADFEEGVFVATLSPAGGKPVAYEFVELTAGTTTLIYATGSLTNQTFRLLADVQTLDEPTVPVPTATVTIIHGIPGEDLGLPAELPVDVFVSDLGCALSDFRFGDVTGRLEVPAGTYDVVVSVADADAGPCNGPVAIDAPGVPFEPGENATVLAHLTADGAPTASKFVNDLSDPGRSKNARVAIHHAAAAPAVDVDLFRKFYFWIWRWIAKVGELESIENGQSASLVRLAGQHVVAISPAGGEPIFQQRLWVPPRQSTQVYAVGSVEGGTFQLIVDRLPLD